MSKFEELTEELTEDERRKLNILAREQIKLKLLQDIRFDLEVCKLENWSYKEFLNELKEMIDRFLKGE